MDAVDRYFQLAAYGTSLRREMLAGITTFLTMAYILFVQPAMLANDFAGQPTGLPGDAVLLATCLSAALASIMMGLYARYPIALAPGMGQNAFFVSVVMALSANGQQEAWRTALGVVLLAGLAFLLISIVGIRELVLEALSPSLRSSISVGIGLFIALIGLKNGGVIVDHPATFVQMAPHGLRSADWLVFWVGFFFTAVLMARRTAGAVLWGIVAATITAVALGKVELPDSWIGLPQHHALLRFDLRGAWQWNIVPFLIMFLYMDVFDTMGTLVGVTQQAGLMREGRLERAQQAMLVDATGTIAGACFGTSTVTSYIESAAGVQQGGRTGLMAITVGLLFLLALPFAPVITVIGAYPPITAAALVIVGSMMARNFTSVAWDEPSEAIPCFLIVLGIPACFSIADGIALGLITYPVIKLLSGKRSEVHTTLIVLAIVLVACLVARAWWI